LKKHVQHILFLLGIGCLAIPQLFLATGCAKIVAPAGGEKDTIAPRIVLEESSQNYQTNFKSDKIELTFNEWVQLNSPTKEIIVSPPLQNNLKIGLKGKTVKIDLSEETLRKNATYTFNFGKAIEDFTEKNAPKDLRFVFSTGTYIDSLVVTGNVFDNTTNKPAVDALVMLYDNLNDSVVKTEKPFYFARTDKDGNFKINNVRSDTFKIFALVDENFNYLYDIETEAIGFVFENLVVNEEDSIAPKIQFNIFKPDPKFRRTSNQTKAYGHLRFVYNQPIYDTLTITAEPSFVTDYVEQIKDTLHFWYTDTTSQRQFFITDNQTYFDTVMVNLPSNTPFFKTNKRSLLENPTLKKGQKPITQNPNKAIELVFQHPFYDIDTSKFILLEDTAKKKVRPYFLRFGNSRRNLSVNYTWKTGTTYELTLLPGAIRDIFGLENDTIALKYHIDEIENYGNIEMALNGLSADSSYVVELLSENNILLETFTVSQKAAAKQIYKAMPTGKYKLKLIIDDNGNGRWDTGEYPSRQPEKIIIGKSEELRPNWDLELILDLNKEK
jgi:hypothetical protein